MTEQEFFENIMGFFYACLSYCVVTWGVEWYSITDGHTKGVLSIMFFMSSWIVGKYVAKGMDS